MLDKASLKLGLDRAVLQSMSGNKDSNVNGVRKVTGSNGCVRLIRCGKSCVFFTNSLLKSSLDNWCKCLSMLINRSSSSPRRR